LNKFCHAFLPISPLTPILTQNTGALWPLKLRRASMSKSNPSVTFQSLTEWSWPPDTIRHCFSKPPSPVQKQESVKEWCVLSFIMHKKLPPWITGKYYNDNALPSIRILYSDYSYLRLAQKSELGRVLILELRQRNRRI
jgi:hypothetical protein